MKILLIGSGAREHALAAAINRSPQKPDLYVYASSMNPGIADIAVDLVTGDITDGDTLMAWVGRRKFDYAVIGPEAPLETGVADRLWQAGIPVIGPTKDLAQLETSKLFTRELLVKHDIGGCPRFKSFDSITGVKEFLEELGDLYVVKANGLMGGKGVKVAGDHLHSHAEAIEYCESLLEQKATFVIEEKMIGLEFSVMSFCGGKTLAHMPAVQDHKRAFEGEEGPNTGGMGSYSDVDHGLPFLSATDILEAQQLNEAVAKALMADFGKGYKGIIYGGFMATADGVKIVEYNARFGDPECLNLLTLLETDMVEIFQTITADELDTAEIRFSPKASVCKYAVPKGYPDKPLKGFPIELGENQADALYLGAVDLKEGQLVGTGSRTVAVVGLGDTLPEAEEIAETAINQIKGDLFHRKDIGTQALIGTRINTMRVLRKSH